MAITQRSQPAIYPLPAPAVFDALMHALSQTPIDVKAADPSRGLVQASKGMSFTTWGENITIYVWEHAPGQTSVMVDSALKFGLVAWGAHERNFRTIFQALNQTLQFQSPSPPAPPPPSGPPPGQPPPV